MIRANFKRFSLISTRLGEIKPQKLHSKRLFIIIEGNRNWIGRLATDMYERIVESEQETIELGLRLADLLQPADVLTLEGDLGAGKTTFTKSIAKGLGITRTVNSPTFTILKQYEGRYPLNHLDVYRLADSDEDLGWDELFYGDAVSIVEWAHLIQEDLPPERLAIQILRLEEDKRQFIFEPIGKRYEQLCKELFE